VIEVPEPVPGGGSNSVADRAPGQLIMVPPEEFGAACRRAQPDDPPTNLTLAPASSRPRPHRGRGAVIVSSSPPAADMGKHTKPSLWSRWKHRAHRVRRPALVAWVDVRDHLTHLLAPDAAAAGGKAKGRYTALCGVDVLPAGMTEVGCGNCWPCHAAASTSIPQQRSRNNR
jgi:hypothetical protein